MQRELYAKIHGIDFVVTVDYEQEDHYCSVSDVLSVRIEGQTKPLKCDLKRFYNDLVDTLQEELESSLLNDKLVYEEIMYDEAKEEGLL